MPDKQQSDAPIPQVTGSNTKQQVLDAYNEVVKRLKEKRETELAPQQRAEEKQKHEAIKVADSLSTEGIGREVGNLRAEISKVLIELSDRMEEEIGKYVRLKRAVEIRENDLKELAGIEKEALSLAALIESQREHKERFESEMADRKESLEGEIASTRASWKEEQKAHDQEIQAREQAEKKRREREAEDYTYGFERQKRLAQEQFDYDKAKMEREIQMRRQELERDLTAREEALKEREAELEQLRARVAASANEQNAAVERAIQVTTERVTREAEAREALLRKEYEGETRVLQSRIESLQLTVKEQQAQIARLSTQIEKSYGQVQEIAVKALEGPGALRIVPPLSPSDRQRGTGQAES